MRRIAGLLSCLLAISVVWSSVLSAQAPAPVRVMLPAAHQINGGSWQAIAVSPDGARLVYAANGRLFTRATTAAGEPTEIAGSVIMANGAPQGVMMPAFSPDGRSVAYWSAADQTLRRIPVAGGTSVVITKADNPTGMTWTADDQIVFGQGPKGILRVAVAGGTPELAVASVDGELLGGPSVLPGNAILFTTITPRQGMPPLARIVAQPAGSTERRVIVDAIAEGHFVPSGHLVYSTDGTLFALKFDSARLAAVGQPVALNQEVRSFNVGQFAVAANGTLVSIAGRRGRLDVALVDRTGRRETVGTVPESVFAPRVSPDGKRLAIDDQAGIWVGELGNLEQMRQIIAPGSATGANQFPLWNDAGDRIYFISTRDGGVQSMFVQNADGSGQAELLARPARAPEGWSLENGFLNYISLIGTSDYGLWRYSLRDKTVAAYIDTPGTAQLSSKFSHDGKWVAFMANDTGQFEIYVQTIDDPSTRVQVTRTGGRIPVWSNDDRELFFTDITGTRLNAVSIQTAGNRITVGQQMELPITGFIQRGTLITRRQYDLMPDGRFLMMFQPPLPLDVTANWADDLRRRVP